MKPLGRMPIERKLIAAAFVFFLLICLLSLPSGLLSGMKGITTASASPLPVTASVQSFTPAFVRAATTPRPSVGGCGPFCLRTLMR